MIPWDIVGPVVLLFFMFVKPKWVLPKRCIRQSLELPEWTGRERESLRADLEAAAEDVSEWSSRIVIVNRNGHILWTTPTAQADRYGLFPEALEAYLEERK